MKRYPLINNPWFQLVVVLVGALTGAATQGGFAGTIFGAAVGIAAGGSIGLLIDSGGWGKNGFTGWIMGAAIAALFLFLGNTLKQEFLFWMEFAFVAGVLSICGFMLECFFRNSPQ